MTTLDALVAVLLGIFAVLMAAVFAALSSALFPSACGWTRCCCSG